MTVVRTRGLAARARALLPVLWVVLAATAARADEPEVATSDPGRADEEGAEAQRDLWFEVPSECAVFVPQRPPDPRVGWDQLLSFASCVQDGAVPRVTSARQLSVLVQTLSEALSPTLLLYLEALQHAPPAVQLRAAYLAGLAHVSLVTRLRSSLGAASDPTDPAEVQRYLQLHAQLEPMLLRAQRTAVVAFTVVGRAAEQDPTLALDPVAAYMITSARVLLQDMRSGIRELTPSGHATSLALHAARQVVPHGIAAALLLPRTAAARAET